MSPDVIYILIPAIFFSIIFSAFFSGAETAITGVSEAKLHKLKSQGDRRAEMISELRADKERLISALLLGNNAFNVISSSLATTIGISLFGTEGVVYAAFIITILILIFAEVLPKAYAFEHPERTSLFIAKALYIITKILFPITRSIQFIVEKMMNFLNKNTGHENFSAEDEIRGAIAMHHQEGRVVKQDKDMLGSILDLRNTHINEVMVHRMDLYSINIDDPANEILDKLIASTHSRVPVWQDNTDNIIGIIHVRDLITQLSNDQINIDNFDFKQLMREPWFIPDTTSLFDQMHAFRAKKNHFALVIDEYGVLMGAVTFEDIIEEIVGQIEDEYDVETDDIQELGNNIYSVKGSTTIRDLNRYFDWQFSDEHASTIAGYIMHELQSIPEEKEKFIINGVEFTITKKTRNEITNIKIIKLPE
jgi:Mg2+/Co2+ transporter CorB